MLGKCCQIVKSLSRGSTCLLVSRSYMKQSLFALDLWDFPCAIHISGSIPYDCYICIAAGVTFGQVKWINEAVEDWVDFTADSAKKSILRK